MALLGGCAREPVPQTLVLVVVDALPEHALEPSGPLGAFARSATRFPGHVAVSTGTNAALASLLTGQFPWEHGVGSLRRRGRTRLADDRTTLAEHLADAGFSTLASVAHPRLRHDFSGLLQGFDQTFEPDLDTRAVRTVTKTWSLAAGALAEELAARGAVHALFVFSQPAHTRQSPPPSRAVLERHLGSFRQQEPRLGPILDTAQEDRAAALERLEALWGRSRGSALWKALQSAKGEAELEVLAEVLDQLQILLERSGRAREATVVLIGLRGVAPNSPSPVAAFPKSLLSAPLAMRLRGRSEPGGFSGTVQSTDLFETLLAAHVAPSERSADAVRAPLESAALSAALSGVAEDSTADAEIVEAFTVDAAGGAGAALTPKHRIELAPPAAPSVYRRANDAPVDPSDLELGQRSVVDAAVELFRERRVGSRWRVEVGAAPSVPRSTDGREVLEVSCRAPQGELWPLALGSSPSDFDRLRSASLGPGESLELTASRAELPIRLGFAGSALDSLDLDHWALGPARFSETPVLWVPVSRRVPNSPSSPSSQGSLGASAAGRPKESSAPHYAARLKHEGGSWWRFEVRAEGDPPPSGVAARSLVCLYPPGAFDEELQVRPLAETVLEPVPGRRDAVWMSGNAPLEVRIRKDADRDLALFAEVDGKVLPPARLFVGERAYATATEIALYLPDWLPGMTDALERDARTPVPPGGVRITRKGLLSTPRRASSDRELEFIRRLGNHE